MCDIIFLSCQLINAHLPVFIRVGKIVVLYLFGMEA